MRIRSIGLLGLLFVFAFPALAAPGNDFVANVRQAERDGLLSKEDALVQLFRYGFDPARVRADLMPESPAPLKCLTAVIVEFENNRGALSPEAVAEIDSYLGAPRAAAKTTTSTYLSPDGLFTLSYETSGVNAPPQADVNPANGVPDYVEKCAAYCDSSWHREVDELGFHAPDVGGGTYQISFQNMGYYGFTQSQGHGSSYIVLENDFVGFPANDDPEGDQLGAAKVTAAHEFKHATQFNTTGAMAMGGWVELDATWMEDVVFDESNDYYGYLYSGSSISDPDQPLDYGGSGSYEDCIWQHFLCENFGLGMGLALMQRREAFPSEAALLSYAEIIAAQGTDFKDAFTMFAAWNYVTGVLADAGMTTYQEAANYPSATTWSYRDVYPDTSAGAVAHTAAHFHQCKGMGTLAGNLRVQFDGQDGTQIRAVVLMRKKAAFGGGWWREDVPLDSLNDGDYTVSIPGAQLKQMAVLVINPKRTGGDASYSMVMSDGTVSTNVAGAVPVATPILLAQNRPNPFNPTTSIDFTLSRQAMPTLVIYDSAGRAVRNLIVGESMDAGAHTVLWDGRDNGGRDVASGVYFYRLDAEKTSIMKKAILIR